MKKNFKLALALILSIMMVLASVPAMAADDDTATTTGTITVNSPVVGATYKAYQIFDLKMNATGDAFSYSIDSNDPFFAAVQTYAATAANGLTLTVSADTAEATVKTYSVSVDESKFDAQAFGVAMRTAIATASPAPTVYDSNATGTDHIVTDNDAVSIKFENLPLGYYLINPTYAKGEMATISLTDGKNTKYEFTKDDFDTDGKLTTAAKTSKITPYVNNTIDDTYVTKYIADNELKNDDGTALTSEQIAQLKTDLKADLEKKAIEQVENAYKNNKEGIDADYNVKEPILVFVDSTTPNAVINEKNEQDKWDIPVNPSPDAIPENIPDHGEPSGGKNIVVNEDPAVYADWSEANIGDSVHYQLRVNAMNFIQNTTAVGKKSDQVKAYNLLDYQSAHMHFDADKKLLVTIVDGAGNKVTDTTDSKYSADDQALNYTSLVNNFLVNSSEADGSYTIPNGDIFADTNKNGIVVPWVKVSEKNPAQPDPTYPVYTTTKVPTGEYMKPEAGHEDEYVLDDEGYVLDEDNARIPLYDTYYVYSIYKSDVTIVVDYYMILDDDAIVDNPGNKNFAQYGYSLVDNKDGSGNPKQPTPPDDDDEPSQKKEVDEATVYTFALAFVKVDNKGNSLAGAKFQLPFYVKANKQEGTYVYAGTKAGTGLVNEVTTEADGVITIKGMKQGTYTFTELEAPEGFNKLDAPFTVEAKKSGDGVTTKTESTIYLDAQGNVTSTVTTTTVTPAPATDADANVTNVPVYQFDPIVNQKGTELPSTGGIGTTIFYVAGSILVLAAAILLITKRRMGAED